MTLRAALIPLALAALAACSAQAPEDAAPAAETPAAAPAAPAEAIADEPAVDPAAAAEAPATDAEAAPAEGATELPASEPVAPPAAAGAPRRSVEGTHYDVIRNGQPFEPLNGKIEVVEVFNYVCPACAMFQPLVNSWKAKQPADLRLTYVPAPFGGNWDIYVRAYYAAEAMGIAAKSHDGLFKAIHVDRALKGERGQDTAEDLAKVYGQFGANPAQFASTMSSFAVNAKFGRARQFIADHGVTSTPTLIVNGRYRIKGRSWDELLQNTDLVVADVRAGAVD